MNRDYNYNSMPFSEISRITGRSEAALKSLTYKYGYTKQQAVEHKLQRLRIATDDDIRPGFDLALNFKHITKPWRVYAH
jgi:hypothetical protein